MMLILKIFKQCIKRVTYQYSPEEMKNDKKHFDNALLKPNLMRILVNLWARKYPYEYAFDNKDNALTETKRSRAKHSEHDREIIALTHDLGLAKINTATHSDNQYVVWLTLTSLGYQFCNKHFQNSEHLKHFWNIFIGMKTILKILAGISVVVTIYAFMANILLNTAVSVLSVALNDPTTFQVQNYSTLTDVAIGLVILTLITSAVTLYLKFSWSHNQYSKVTRKSLITYVLNKRDGRATNRNLGILGSIANVAFDVNKE